MVASRDDFIIAIRSAILKKGNQQRFSLLSLILFSIIFLVLGSFNFRVIDTAKTSIKEIVYRSSFIISGPEHFIEKNFIRIKDHFSHYKNYKEIKYKLEGLQSKDLSNQIIKLENIKYKKLIDDYFIQDNETFAKVLIDKNSPFLRSVILNKGSKNNIDLGMAVLDEAYLIGKVVEVNYFTSRVLLLSDINSKIPVTLSPGEIQGIMSGNGDQAGILQYTKSGVLKKSNKDLIVTTSGAGGLFKSGILIGKLKAKKPKENNTSYKNDLKIDFYKDFTQLKYVKVVSFFKEKKVLDKTSKMNDEQLDNQIAEFKKQQENIRMLIEQKKISDEIRVKIEEENTSLKDSISILQSEISKKDEIFKKNEAENKEIKFGQLNLLYGRKCKKTLFNNLYKVGTSKYKACILNKGKKN